MTRDSIILANSEDGVCYLSLGRRCPEFLGGHYVMGWEYNRAHATRLPYHDAVRIARRLNARDRRSIDRWRFNTRVRSA